LQYHHPDQPKNKFKAHKISFNKKQKERHPPALIRSLVPTGKRPRSHFFAASSQDERLILDKAMDISSTAPGNE
jgi:hypothetical protein